MDLTKVLDLGAFDLERALENDPQFLEHGHEDHVCGPDCDHNHDHHDHDHRPPRPPSRIITIITGTIITGTTTMTTRLGIRHP